MVAAGETVFSATQLAALGASGKAEAVLRTLGTDGRSYALLGLGSETPSVDEWRDLGGVVGRSLATVAKVELQLAVEGLAEAEALLEGYALGRYDVKGSLKAQNVQLLTNLTLDKASLKRIAVIAHSVHAARDLANTPANLLYPAEFARIAAAEADKFGLAVQIWDEKQLAKDNLGLIAAVGAGSARPPRLVKLVHKPKGAKIKLALVGKGITFDTGGLAVKPLSGMLGMKYDMTGAATVLAAMTAIAQLALPIEVTGYLCLAENMPSGSAMRPGDVFTARNGKTVEVTNPDAEGRLVLADGISLASEGHPDLVVDVATLTGAARVALGVRYTALMGSGNGVKQLEGAASTSGEPVWEMPLAKELRSHLDSSVADLQNSKVGSAIGGMIVGGLFIAEFVGNKKDGSKLDWAHLDIAGPADNEGSAYGHTPKGPTGVMVRTLVALAEQMSA